MKRQPLWKKLTALAAALALTAALAGCGSSGGGSDAAPGETAATESFSMDNAALAAADGGGAATLTPQATGESARKIIYNADLSLESTDFDAARTALTDAVEQTAATFRIPTFPAAPRTRTATAITPCASRPTATATFWRP